MQHLKTLLLCTHSTCCGHHCSRLPVVAMNPCQNMLLIDNQLVAQEGHSPTDIWSGEIVTNFVVACVRSVCDLANDCPVCAAVTHLQMLNAPRCFAACSQLLWPVAYATCLQPATPNKMLTC